MARKDENNTFNTLQSGEESTQVQQILENVHQIASDLHNSTSQEQAEHVLARITGLSEASQMPLLKALSRIDETDAADILAAINELSSQKSIRKEARRSLIRLEEARIYPNWTSPEIGRASCRER